MPALDIVLKARLEEAADKGLRRKPRAVVPLKAPLARVQGKELISFCSNDYLGLSQHPQVLEASAQALRDYGASACASRLVSGNHPLYAQIEEQLSSMKHTENACVFGSGYLANLGVISAVVDGADLILTDRLSHACMIDGAHLSGATLKRFKHHDMTHLRSLLDAHRSQYRYCLIMTETVFSMDGDRPPLNDLSKLAEQYDAWLMTDDAHGLGLFTDKNPAHIQMGTLSKAAASYGGYVCGSDELIECLFNFSRSLLFSTGLPPAVIAASVASLKLMKDQPELAQKALSNAALFCRLLDLPEAQSTIVPIILKSEELTLKVAAQLLEDGFFVSAIRPPTVPKDTSRLRFAFTALHTHQQIEKVVEGIKAHGWLEHSGD